VLLTLGCFAPESKSRFWAKPVRNRFVATRKTLAPRAPRCATPNL